MKNDVITVNKAGNASGTARGQSGFRKYLLKHLFRRKNGRVQRQVKDRLFRFLFEKDKEALLQLYNALNGTAYQDSSMLEVVTIENAVYIVMKNDVAFMIAGTINLYEHQSTWCPNMPVRFLIYLAEEYQKLIEATQKSLYGTKRIMLPTPQCVVFYNGMKTMPEEQVLKLSDSFVNWDVEADVELRVHMVNINYGCNTELMEKCETLCQYAQFVEISRQYAAAGLTMPEALEGAILYCIEHNILKEFLSQNRAEVLGMLLEEFDAEKYERTIREEGIEEGMEEGREIGYREGLERTNRLTRLLLEQNRMEDLKRALEDTAFQERLFRKFGL